MQLGQEKSRAWNEVVVILQTERSDHSEMRSPHARLAYLAFCLLFFFVIFGTDMPFREQPGGVEDIARSNQLRQVIYTILFSIAIVALLLEEPVVAPPLR